MGLILNCDSIANPNFSLFPPGSECWPRNRVAASCGVQTICSTSYTTGKWLDSCRAGGGVFSEWIPFRCAPTGWKAGTQNHFGVPTKNLCLCLQAEIPDMPAGFGSHYTCPAGTHTITFRVIENANAAGLRLTRASICLTKISTCTVQTFGSLGTWTGAINVSKLGTKTINIAGTRADVKTDDGTWALYYQMYYEHISGQSKFNHVYWTGSVNTTLVPFNPRMGTGHVDRAGKRDIVSH